MKKYRLFQNGNLLYQVGQYLFVEFPDDTVQGSVKGYWTSYPGFNKIHVIHDSCLKIHVSSVGLGLIHHSCATLD